MPKYNQPLTYSLSMASDALERLKADREVVSGKYRSAMGTLELLEGSEDGTRRELYEKAITDSEAANAEGLRLDWQIAAFERLLETFAKGGPEFVGLPRVEEESEPPPAPSPLEQVEPKGRLEAFLFFLHAYQPGSGGPPGGEADVIRFIGIDLASLGPIKEEAWRLGLICELHLELSPDGYDFVPKLKAMRARHKLETKTSLEQIRAARPLGSKMPPDTIVEVNSAAEIQALIDTLEAGKVTPTVGGLVVDWNTRINLPATGDTRTLLEWNAFFPAKPLEKGWCPSDESEPSLPYVVELEKGQPSDGFREAIKGAIDSVPPRLTASGFECDRSEALLELLYQIAIEEGESTLSTPDDLVSRRSAFHLSSFEQFLPVLKRAVAELRAHGLIYEDGTTGGLALNADGRAQAAASYPAQNYPEPAQPAMNPEPATDPDPMTMTAVSDRPASLLDCVEGGTLDILLGLLLGCAEENGVSYLRREWVIAELQIRGEDWSEETLRFAEVQARFFELLRPDGLALSGVGIRFAQKVKKSRSAPPEPKPEAEGDPTLLGNILEIIEEALAPSPPPTLEHLAFSLKGIKALIGIKLRHQAPAEPSIVEGLLSEGISEAARTDLLERGRKQRHRGLSAGPNQLSAKAAQIFELLAETPITRVPLHEITRRLGFGEHNLPPFLEELRIVGLVDVRNAGHASQLTKEGRLQALELRSLGGLHSQRIVEVEPSDFNRPADRLLLWLDDLEYHDARDVQDVAEALKISGLEMSRAVGELIARGCIYDGRADPIAINAHGERAAASLRARIKIQSKGSN